MSQFSQPLPSLLHFLFLLPEYPLPHIAHCSLLGVHMHIPLQLPQPLPSGLQVFFAQLLQPSVLVLLGAHTCAFTHLPVFQLPHVQLLLHVLVLFPLYPLSHAALSVAPVLHAPAPLQLPQLPVVQLPLEVLHVTVLVCVPLLQLPHFWLAAGLEPAAQSFFPETQVPHEQLLLHVCVPVPQDCVEPGLHVPPPLQLPQLPHALPLLLHVLVCFPVPQLPQL
jgi:hypothetical protein